MKRAAGILFLNLHLADMLQPDHNFFKNSTSCIILSFEGDTDKDFFKKMVLLLEQAGEKPNEETETENLIYEACRSERLLSQVEMIYIVFLSKVVEVCFCQKQRFIVSLHGCPRGSCLSRPSPPR